MPLWSPYTVSSYRSSCQTSNKKADRAAHNYSSPGENSWTKFMSENQRIFSLLAFNIPCRAELVIAHTGHHPTKERYFNISKKETHRTRNSKVKMPMLKKYSVYISVFVLSVFLSFPK
ncbi:hypothetical protein AVEN_188147-1 [Araneus ventricosus]|uniref:Uncharacterized protein n=1 Tax=Araneus ventricosus TaxID=182803 RepID=A0A4Y2NDP7_ARAVE|nr:hypothetical protein AVEN_188147-1 [Araneus ventricosus]